MQRLQLNTAINCNRRKPHYSKQSNSFKATDNSAGREGQNRCREILEVESESLGSIWVVFNYPSQLWVTQLNCPLYLNLYCMV